ncbi:MAG: NADH-quinone oxidoreductase subunit N [Candidatus Omnitrophica bacterium]|nr:NADH-quinone oxidoreductase subunit N [Candidatus Omnitrophota bacterium]
MIAAATPTGWSLMLPELWLGGLLLILLGLDLRWKDRPRSPLGALTALGLLAAIPFLAWQSGLGSQTLLGGMYRIDPLGIFFKGIFLATALLVTLMAREMGRSFERDAGEFYLLILTCTLGMFFVASAGDFLMLFVSLELITISFYVMTAYLKTDLRSLEAGLKYLILGSVASGLFLYGIAFVYGATGSTQFAQIRAVLQGAGTAAAAGSAPPPLPAGLLFGLLMILGGILFKTAAVPFQLWVPDVYQGAPTPVTAFLSVGSKSAGFLVAFRVLVELFLPARSRWSGLIALLAGLTILYGNLGAIPQKNIKRLFGYSSIGHAGYLLIGLAAGSALGSTAITFYLAGYLVTNLAAFLVISAFSRQAGSDEMADYAGLSQRSPLLAAAMFLALLSLAGVPPLAGFFGKFLLLMSAVREGYLWLAAIGAAAVVISLYYYLLLVKRMYVDPPADPTPVPVSLPVRIALIACLIGILGIGIWQGPFVNLSFASVKSLF